MITFNKDQKIQNYRFILNDFILLINMDFTDFILEDWESEEDGNVKLNGLTEKEWMTFLFFIWNS